MPVRWYHPGMQTTPCLEGPFLARGDGSGQVVFEAQDPQPRVVVVAGYEGPSLPPGLEASRLERTGERSWRLTTRDGAIDFTARGVEWLEPLPRLFDGLLAPFVLKQRERALVRILLQLLKLPGGAWLLRRWHDGRH